MADKKSQRFDQKAYIQQYQKEHFTRLIVALSKKNDADIIARLSREQNKSQYVKMLIRSDLKNDDGNSK